MHPTNKGIVWLASYPKSGNTWFRVFLTYLLNPHLEDLNLQQQPLMGVGAAGRFLMDNVLGFDSKLLHEDDLARLRPKIYDWHAMKPGIQYFKIHDAYYTKKHNNPIVPAASSIGIIYFIRNPLDVVISFAHHMSCSIDESIHMIASPALALAGFTTPLMAQVRQICSSWSWHVQSWVNNQAIRCLVVRYEDMHAAPLLTFSNIINFLRYDACEQAIALALKKSQFLTLQQNEQVNGFKESAGDGKVFFRKGIVGDWVNTLTARQVKQIVTHHGYIMRQFGYLDKHNRPLQ